MKSPTIAPRPQVAPETFMFEGNEYWVSMNREDDDEWECCDCDHVGPAGLGHACPAGKRSEPYAAHLVALAARAGHTLVLDHTLLEWDEDFQEWFIGNDIALIWLHYRVDGSTRRI